MQKNNDIIISDIKLKLKCASCSNLIWAYANYVQLSNLFIVKSDLPINEGNKQTLIST